MNIEIYIDGACFPNPGRGGWAAVLVALDEDGNIIKQRDISGTVDDTTNNRMELESCIQALNTLLFPCTVTIYSDSMYVVQGASKAWKVTTNLDLWERLREAESLHTVTYQHVKGHSGNRHNERADWLANKAASGRAMNTKETTE